MEIGKIKVEGIEVLSVEQLRLDAEVNQHARLQMVCLIDKEHMQDYVMLPQRESILEVFAEDKMIFCGTVTETICKTKKDSTKLYITLLNGSYLLDREKKSKSYQNIAMTYQEIAQDKATTIYEGEDRPIGSIVVQYQETDWEFLKRIASRLSTGVYASVRQKICELHWGMAENTTGNSQITQYTVEKDINFYKECVENNKKVSLADCILYEFESPEILNVGDTVTIDSRTICIVEAHWQMEQADFVGSYKGKSKNGVCYTEKYLYDMPGTALEGTVIDVSGDKVKVHLAVDETQDIESAYWFPFSAMEASADGSGWYYMPEKGDCVKVCIPAWEETGAFAVSAVSTYKGENSSTDMMADTSVKYMRNPSGKQMQLTPGQIQADGGNGASVFTMDTEGNIDLSGKQMVSMQATEMIELEAGDTIDIYASEILSIKADMTGEIMMNDTGEIQHLGGHVNINSEE